MAKFCTRCGRPLTNGDVCSFCYYVNHSVKSSDNSDYTPGAFESFKNFVGIGDPEINKGDTYEKEKRIVPDCIMPTDGEIPVKQYELAILQNRFLVFPYAKAIGRLQVTNKRVIFRAPGHSLFGRTTLQHEFAIDELDGIEIRRDCYFSFWDLIGGLLISALGNLVIWLLSTLLVHYDVVPLAVFSLMVIVIGIGVFFVEKEHFYFKIFCLGCVRRGCVGIYKASMEYELIKSLILILSISIGVLLIAMIIARAIRPNLVFIVKNKSSHDTIDITRSSVKKKLFGKFIGSERDHTGFNEVLPGNDAYICIKEINALISDIQKLGEFGIDKWKS